MQILRGNIYIGTSIDGVVPTYLGEINRLDDAILELTVLSDNEIPTDDAATQYYVVFRSIELKGIRQKAETEDGIKFRVKLPSSILLKADIYEGQLVILHDDDYTFRRVSSNIFSFKVNKLLED